MKTYRLIGPPGCGKTYALSTKWVPRAVELHGEESVLICSLTRSAAQEIASRVNLHRQQVGTLHSFAFRALGSPPLAQDDKNVVSWNESQPPMWHITGQSRRSNIDLEFDTNDADQLGGDELLNQSGILRNRLVPMKEWNADIRRFYTAWRDWKRKMQFLDFTDLIEMPVEFGTMAPGNPAVIVCDEAQDFTELDMRLIRYWGEGCEFVVMTGDYNQAIFTFRGASPKAFLPDDVPDEEVSILGQSYRVPERVRAYASDWIKLDTEHRVFPYKGRLGKDGKSVPGVVAKTPHFSLGSPRGRTLMAEDIKKRVAKGKECMILATCKYMLTPILATLRERGIPFHNPYRVTEGGWNPMRGGTDRLNRFLSIYSGEQQAWTWGDMKRWTQPLSAKTFLRNGAVSEIESMAKKYEDSAHLSTSELRSLLKPGVYDELMDIGSLDTAVGWYESRILQSKLKSMQLAISVYKEFGYKCLTETPRVIVGTIHSVKGGAADYVYLSPDIGKSGGREWRRLSAPEGRNAIIRAMYVGMTRARDGLALLGTSSQDRVDWI